MQRILLSSLLVFGIAVAGLAQTKPTGDKPSGTVVKEKHTETVVEPRAKPVKVTPDVIRAAQTKLTAKGYDAGPATGSLNARTRAAIHKFQSDEKLAVTGRLDQPTLTKLNVGGTKVISSAPADVGRGAKAAGHDLKEGHPLAAGKAMGKGVGRFGKKVGQGTKAVVVGTKDKIVGTKPKQDENKSENPQQ